jgi:hypothetical protein
LRGRAIVSWRGAPVLRATGAGRGSPKEKRKLAARRQGAPIFDDFGRILIEPFELTRWFMAKQKAMTERAQRAEQLRTKSKSAGLPSRRRKDTHAHILVGNIGVLFVDGAWQYVTVVERRVSWERTCTSSTKSELYDVRLSGVEIAEGGLADLDAEGLRAAGELAGGEVRQYNLVWNNGCTKDNLTTFVSRGAREYPIGQAELGGPGCGGPALVQQA